MRRLLNRLRTAWLVLIGRIDPNALEKAQFALDQPVHVIRAAAEPVHLRAEWWTHGPDVNHAVSLVKRELMERAGEMILYSENADPFGGYRVSGDLYIYRMEQEQST